MLFRNAARTVNPLQTKAFFGGEKGVRVLTGETPCGVGEIQGEQGTQVE